MNEDTRIPNAMGLLFGVPLDALYHQPSPIKEEVKKSYPSNKWTMERQRIKDLSISLLVGAAFDGGIDRLDLLGW
jgi:hypothetical protein